MFLRKYATALAGATKIRVPMQKAATTDFATASDWTPATGDVRVSIDGGAAANIATLPTYTNEAWEYVLSTGELTGKSILVKIVDSATKLVNDNAFIIETYGHASAMYPDDRSVASPTAPENWNALSIDVTGVVKANLAQILGTALTETAGQIATAFRQFFNVLSPTSTMNNITSVGTVSGSVGTVAGSVGSVAGNVNGTVNDLASGAAATVKAQVVAALTTDTYPEPTGRPSQNASLKDKIAFIFAKLANKHITTSTADRLRNDSDTADLASASISDDGTTFTKGKDA